MSGRRDSLRVPARPTLVQRLHQDDVGALVTAVPIIFLMFLLLAGLVIDSSRQLTARARAVSYAEEAARAGAEAVDPASEPLELDHDKAVQQVNDYCAAASLREPQLVCGPHVVGRQSVTVTATISSPSGLLGLVGIDTLHASGQGEARPLIGVTGQDAR
jgi:Putative Flp pilus-assembly TadE/G-like